MAQLAKILNKRESWLSEVTAIVRSGGVVALAYERLFGLAADAFNQEAIERICAIKNRRDAALRRQPISVIVPSQDQVGRVAVELTKTATSLVDRFWPGPLTVLVKARPGLPESLVGPGGLVGVRVAGPSPAAELAKHCGLILTATSANLTGGDDAMTHKNLLELDGVDAIVEGRVAGPPGSTIVDCSGQHPRVLRAGCIEIEEGRL